jgi:hypothetical protein
MNGLPLLESLELMLEASGCGEKLIETALVKITNHYNLSSSGLRQPAFNFAIHLLTRPPQQR